MEAAERLSELGIEAEVIDLRTLRPFDHQTLLRSLGKTNRLVAVEEGPLTGGWAGEVLAVVAEHGLHDIDDVWRLTTPDHPIPFSPPLEDAFLPAPRRSSRRFASGLASGPVSRVNWVTVEEQTVTTGPQAPASNGHGDATSSVANSIGALNIVGSRVREERLRQKIGVRELARRVGVSASLISQVELGKASPSVGTLYAIVNELGLSLDELFFQQPNRGRGRAGDEHPEAETAAPQRGSEPGAHSPWIPPRDPDSSGPRSHPPALSRRWCDTAAARSSSSRPASDGSGSRRRARRTWTSCRWPTNRAANPARPTR